MAEESQQEPTETKAEDQAAAPAKSETVEASPAPTDSKAESSKKIKSPINASHWHRFTAWYKGHKKLAIPVTIVVLLAVLFIIPFTRYAIAGLFIKKDYSVAVTDSQTNDPVSGALVTIDSKTGTTNGTGKAVVKQVPVGQYTAKVTKKYYKDNQTKVTVPILDQKTTPTVQLTATGRQVKITVTNLISKQALAEVNIKVADTTAKTDQTGNATVVLPAGEATQKATLSLDGYNSANVDVKVSNQTVEQNNYTLTPAGKVYFLSKLSGKIDVVKTNLDGTSRQTVLAGTGTEDDTGTVLLASRDWKYLALLSKRDSGLPQLYLIDTSNDQLTSMDSGNASFTPVGWSDDNFVYVVNRNSILDWQAGKQALKSYNAPAKKITQLDQTAGQGTNSLDYAHEAYGSTYLVNGNVIYDKTWQGPTYYTPDVLTIKQAGIYSINVSGSGAQTLKNFGYEAYKYTYLDSIPYQANQIYYDVTEKSNPTTYYVYNGGKVTTKDDLSNDFTEYYNEGATTYLQSPTSNQTFWADARDGKNTLFVGDTNGGNGKQVATLSDYLTYGWYTDNYLLVSKNSSELYILPKSGIKSDADAIKITDYHKPKQNFQGYGGGYGGI